MQSLYVFINLVNKNSLINMYEKPEIILVEAAVLVFEAFANSENICVFLHRVNCKCLKLVGENLGNMVVHLFHSCTF